MFIIKHKCEDPAALRRQYPSAAIIDVTSNAPDEMVRLSPFYPHGGIPVPFSNGWTAPSVESVWQGLKVFERADIDTSLFGRRRGWCRKRTQRQFGRTKGHRKGVRGAELLDYVTARRLIYLPTYRWMLENRASDQLARIRELAEKGTVILLDYDTNADVYNTSSPLSHASLIKTYIEGNYPA